MRTLGWIRLGDVAACGATVEEGFPAFRFDGIPYSFKGARMACPQRCVIAEANDRFWLPNGCAVPHHGNRTSAGCPLHSTLNGISGYWSTDEGAVPDQYVPNGAGGWVPCIHASKYDLVFAVRDTNGRPLTDVPYRVVLDTGRVVEGRTDSRGYTSVIHSDQPDQATIIVPYYGDIQTTTDSGLEPDACDC